MRSKNKFKKILDWFFEEEKQNEKLKDKEEEYIEINFRQAVGIAVITITFVAGASYEHIIEYFSGLAKNTGLIDAKIENNYFEKKKTVENGDFSKGLEHWSTSDGGKTFPDSKSKAFLEENAFYSPPYSLKIESIRPANRYYYTKNANAGVLDNPYESRSCNNWLGVLPNSKVKISLWYKGDIVTFYMQCLTRDGSWNTLGQSSGVYTDEWKKIEIEKTIPPDGRAIMLEITLNKADGMPAPMVWIDDVNIEVQGYAA